ncbi:MAG: hypothetical protein IJ789_09010 [Bacteroidales bacterium]|nr:hypothetical protein [Bacteroidales bacterium]
MKQLSRIFLAIAVVLAAASCTKHDEIDFAGTIIGYNPCTGLDNVGYLVELNTPTEVGSTIEYNNQTYNNVIILYDPAVRIYVHDKVSGTFYYSNNYAKANCNYTKLYDIPEGVFWKIKVQE